MNPNRITRNTFERLRNTDADKSKLNPNQYIEAHNIEVSGEGSYFAVRNINGTTTVQAIIADVVAGVEVPGVKPARFLIGGEYYNCLVFFSYIIADLAFKIWCYDIENDDVYELYEEAVDADFDTDDRVIDVINFPENGTDILYFTDNYHEPRQLKCEIPASYSANFLTKYDLSLLKKGANGTIFRTGVNPGGSLLSGTYQFTYRMVDPVNKKFTKWSTLTSPFHVYSASNSDDPVYSGIGLPTSRKIDLLITPSFEETDNFNYLQLAVLENISVVPAQTLSLLGIEEISGVNLTYAYKANTRIGTIPLTDITVDLAQIERVKTINVKDSRLFGGNVNYTALEFDNGDPEITSGSISRVTSGRDCYSVDSFSCSNIGYFRGEVYRFGIVYSDEYGNKSPVKHLDLSGVTDNDITSGLTDMKFPSRSTDNLYTIFNASDQIRALGLTLSGIVNHPSWARSFEIVRVKRKKNILFQTPVIPMTSVYGVGALGLYPTEATVGHGDRQVNADAQPQTPGRVLVPKNLLRPEQRSIVKKNTAGSVSGTYWEIGECYYQYSGDTEGYQFSMLFPPDTMYSETPYQFTGSEKLDVVDYVLMKANIVDKDATKTPTVVSGEDINTNISGNLYGLQDEQYYFHSTWNGKAIDSDLRNIPIVDSETFTTFGQPASVGGNSVMDYDALQTQGVDFGFKPTVQKCAVVKLANYAPDIIEIGGTFSAGTLNPYSPGAEVVAGAGVRYETTLSNKLINEYSNYSVGKYVGAISVANVVIGLGDDRYGDADTSHEFISTGAKYTFTESEVESLIAGDPVSVDINVFGGDCFVGPHLFKVTDSHYSITANNTNANGSDIHTEIAKWSKVFTVDPNFLVPSYVIRMPVALEGAAQFVQVVLESEYNGEVREQDIVNAVDDESGIPIYNVDTKEAMRTPLTYNYNRNLSQQNDQKIFVPKPQYSFEQNYFGARVVYSDIKIYNSDAVGFDVFRVGDLHDLEEKNGNITKLALSGDDLIAIQERGIIYLPTGSQQIEQSDSGTLAVRSGDVIGKPIVIDSERGSQHLRSIIETGGTIYIADNRNKAIYSITGRDFQIISDLDNDSSFREMLNAEIPEKNLFGVYDPIRKEYWIVDNESHVCHIFNEKYKGWVGEYDFTSASKLFAGASTNQKLYLIGKNDDLVVAEMYTGTVNQLFGESVTPSITVVCNPDEPVAKTFDNLLISSNQRLDEIDVVVERETELGNQTVSGMNIDTSPVEGSYRIKTLRDASGSRLRGLRALMTIKFKAVKSTLREIATKYRHSARTPW
jgi:hypothetical protein